MKEIEFDASFGNKIKKVKLSSNIGGSDGWQVSIDNYYQGTIFFKDGMWKAHLNNRSILTSDDILILGEMIQKNTLHI
jgi:hypothetical protein